MLTTIKKIGFALLILITYSKYVIAHDEAMESGWCEGGEVSILGHFQLNENLLAEFKGDENPVCTQYKSCGQFDDDDYRVSRRTALGFCQSLSSAELTQVIFNDHHTVRPIFYAPENFKNKDANHHKLYAIAQGIEFSCAICTLPKEVSADKYK